MSLAPKILIIRQMALGDVILATPIVEQLYNNYGGNCHIDVITRKPEVFENSPYVRRVYDSVNLQELDHPYDVSINLDLAYEKQPQIHIVEAYAMYAFGTKNRLKSRRPKIYPSLQDKNYAKSLISLNNLECGYVVIHMRHDTWPSRNIPEKSWMNIVEKLLERTNYKIVQVGSVNEHAFNFDSRLVDLRGKTTIHVLKELLESSKLYVGIDSGTLHIAACTDVPIISMFTSAHHLLRMPLDRPESSVFIPILPDVDCYGCQSRIEPPITGVICSRGDPYDPPCIRKFSIDEFCAGLQLAVSC